VLLLRDVFDYSTNETAEALDMTEANVKVALMRARRKMNGYGKDRGRLSPERRQATRRALEQFLLYLSTRDAAGLERLLAEDVISLSDGGGEVSAARQAVRGRDKVLRLILGLAAKALAEPRFSIRSLNALPAILVEDVRSITTAATRYTIHFELDDRGSIRGLHAVLAPSKLSAIK